MIIFLRGREATTAGEPFRTRCTTRSAIEFSDDSAKERT